MSRLYIVDIMLSTETHQEARYSGAGDGMGQTNATASKGPAKLCGLRLCGVGITLPSQKQASKRQKAASRVSARVWRVFQPSPTRKRGPKGDDAMCPNTLGASGKAEPAVGTSVNPCLCGDQAVPSISSRESLLVLSLSRSWADRRDRYVHCTHCSHRIMCVRWDKRTSTRILAVLGGIGEAGPQIRTRIHN